mgnify:CR=1 FL=1
MRSCALTEPTFMEDATLNYMRSMESFLKYLRTRDLTKFIYIYHKVDLFCGGASG